MPTAIPPLVESFPFEAASLLVDQLRGRASWGYRTIAAAGLQIVSYGLHVALPDDDVKACYLPAGSFGETLTHSELEDKLAAICDECGGDHEGKCKADAKFDPATWLLIIRTVLEIIGNFRR
jgi:hypothetical protein